MPSKANQPRHRRPFDSTQGTSPDRLEGAGSLRKKSFTIVNQFT
jgi:hypothetical protein